MAGSRQAGANPLNSPSQVSWSMLKCTEQRERTRLGVRHRGGARRSGSWLAECGFEVTKTIVKDPADMPPDVIAVQAILSATKTA